MALVVDASVALSWCFADEVTPLGQHILGALRASFAVVPALWLLEVKNALLVAERRGRITAQGSREFLDALAALDIRIDSTALPLNENILLDLARRNGLTAYDAAYLELAKRRDLPLATLDKTLLRAASAEDVRVMAHP